MLSINHIRTFLLKIIVIFVFLGLQTLQTQSQSLQENQISKEMYRCLMGIVKVTKYSPFSSYLFIGADGCLSCLEKMPEMIMQSNSDRKRRICVILVGADSLDAQVKNIIYRGIPHFSYLSVKELINFKKAHNNQPFWYNIAIKQEKNRAYSLLHHQTIEKATEFLLKN